MVLAPQVDSPASGPLQRLLPRAKDTKRPTQFEPHQPFVLPRPFVLPWPFVSPPYLEDSARIPQGSGF
jgi:hypothetical protein